MALLPDTDRARIWRGLMRWWSQERETLGAFDKSQLRDAVNATDTWIDDNQSGYNAALPQPFRGEATQTQKVLLFCAVALARVNTPLLRQVFGEVD